MALPLRGRLPWAPGGQAQRGVSGEAAALPAGQPGRATAAPGLEQLVAEVWLQDLRQAKARGRAHRPRHTAVLCVLGPALADPAQPLRADPPEAVTPLLIPFPCLWAGSPEPGEQRSVPNSLIGANCARTAAMPRSWLWTALHSPSKASRLSMSSAWRLLASVAWRSAASLARILSLSSSSAASARERCALILVAGHKAALPPPPPTKSLRTGTWGRPGWREAPR